MTPAPVLLSTLFFGCSPAADSAAACNADALSTCRAPTQSEDWYVEQALLYFDTLDASAPPENGPTYSERVARWEWPPWLKLTGYGREMVEAVDALVLVGIPDTTVPDRDCRAFETAPFARCRVVFDYTGQTCPIYEEFTFNEAGEMTFVEAWSDLDGLRPMDGTEDPWAESDSVARLSTRVPGLGAEDGWIEPEGDAMTRAAAADADVADLQVRLLDFWTTWNAEYVAAGDDLFERGCGWE